MRVGAVGVDSERELRVEFGENLSNLLKESLVKLCDVLGNCKKWRSSSKKMNARHTYKMKTY